MRLLLLAPISLFTISASANDTFVTLGAGGLVPTKTTAITMVAEDLTISTHQITVSRRVLHIEYASQTHLGGLELAYA